jgi:pimeloyl-ACP methyl ester carboxylesterase
MIPRANKLTKPAPYRDYPKTNDRINLMLRIMHRIEKTCQITKEDEKVVMKKFLMEWFHIEKNKEHKTKNGVTTMMAASLTTMTNKKLSRETRRESSQDDNENDNSNVKHPPQPIITISPSASPDNSENDDDDDDDDESDSTPTESSPNVIVAGAAAAVAVQNDNDDDNIVLYRQDMDEFFAWAFFGRFHDTLQRDELDELERIYNELDERHDLTFPPREEEDEEQKQQDEIKSINNDNKNTKQTTEPESHICKARCMSLEPMRAVYRPLFVYLLVLCIKIGAGVILRMFGFQRMVSESGLVAWFRPARSSISSNHDNSSSSSPSSASPLPLLFFHGIAPGGISLYLPLLLFGFATEADRPVFFFENRSISCAIDFQPLTEEQTVDGVIECLDRCGIQNTDVTLMGHSFGSCTITWLVAAALASTSSSSSRRRFTNSIKQIVLIDPVAILLSEPDVMVNFLYSQEVDKIRAVASSELFTEMYLRRHFAWYNSELYLEDVSKLDGCRMVVALSGKDEIINATKVKQEIERHGEAVTDLIYWTNVGHGASVPSPSRWRAIKEKMLFQEKSLLEETKKAR